MTQYWYNGIMMSKVTENEAKEIINNIKNNPEFKVFDRNMPDFFSVEKI